MSSRQNGMALFGFALGIVIAIRMKKGFWVGFGFAILGGLLFRGLGAVLFPEKEEVTLVIENE